MYTVYDAAAAAYLPPFYQNTTAQALRAWQSTINDPQSNFSKYSADYTLFQIGEYDDQTGNITMLDAKINLGTALEHKTSHERPLILNGEKQ